MKRKKLPKNKILEYWVDITKKCYLKYEQLTDRLVILRDKKKSFTPCL